ncbi:hypothetical protein ElyMa_004990900 [Elysia marginata]|uniref:Uncharacterized protein n=1 Tax=Elysia marginata TaxID=1093978 RepID=A0AAV4J5V9_9GAST|nr:hypothetical protein ElyMa_004990900 [Elysia marginata]
MSQGREYTTNSSRVLQTKRWKELFPMYSRPLFRCPQAHDPPGLRPHTWSPAALPSTSGIERSQRETVMAGPGLAISHTTMTSPGLVRLAGQVYRKL